ncbi:non-hydrolyzing UDP-N-acetylglucosamine 2-epimerase [Klenkia taihuensis]|uniref:UDP-N-acetylglucosamine 2-epimerase (Non-hydrolysing) n=1 Tax=Klenkia taihuensis TaxID=1225127 RepID=A0A1I1N0R2_9ACTN|nr:UDP-N-acetylglucosamine 2-epimerase (non-hydrolyzing) [Klenkia taihuensis]GHE12333.1 UDP-N-acetyl glucosamine 2-epimerase [Klenkia taihuensis]SFC90936.1 UDP-N-acetylglucosamine 2-epimerase (non-hydrolysing) [Klenkia taihuensis]
MTPRVAVVMGTRPEIIKLAPVVAALGPAASPLATGQHWDADLTDVFFAGVGMPRPVQPLRGVGGRDRAGQVAAMLTGLTDWFRTDRPDAVVVQGDTNSANAGAQAAHHLGIPVVHVEAGLRSFDRAMPEEVNRLVIGAVADVHCAATRGNAEHLLRAGTPASAVHVTGNTIVEATRRALPAPAVRAAVQAAHGVVAGQYVLATVHRPENTDDPERLRALLQALDLLGLPVLLPLHPRTRAALTAAGAVLPPAVRGTGPVDHATFLALAAGARLLVSDSGGVQEEVTVLGKPLVVVRNSTERPEAVDAGFAELTGPEGVLPAARRLLRPGWPEELSRRPSPFGDGRAAERVAALTLAAAGHDGAGVLTGALAVG